MMGGEVNWQALPYICEILGTENPELLVNDLITIRDHMRNSKNAES